MRADPFQEIRQRVSALDAARFYGVNVSRSGTALCPWHSDRHPSLKLYSGDRGCWCFACQHGGDVIELVAGILGVSRVQAAQQINRDFALGLSFSRDKETTQERREREERRAELERYKSFLRWLEEAQIMLCAVHRVGWLARSTPPEELTDAEAEAVRELPTVAYYLEVLAGPQKKNLEAEERIQAEIDQLREVSRIREGVQMLCRLAARLSQPLNKPA